MLNESQSVVATTKRETPPRKAVASPINALTPGSTHRESPPDKPGASGSFHTISEVGEPFAHYPAAGVAE